MGALAMISNRRYEQVPVANILENLVQIRAEYAEEPLEELSGSVSDKGLLQPIMVAAVDDVMFELIIGSRRLRVAKRNELETIEAIVVEGDSPLNYILMALEENLHREDLNPFEEARAFLRLMKDYGLGVEQVATSTRKGTHYVTARIQLLSLPDKVQALMAAKELGLGFVSVLANLPTGEEQAFYAEKALVERLTPPELRALINRAQDREVVTTRRRDMSVQKASIRIQMFTKWVQKLAKNRKLTRNLNAEERAMLLAAVQDLETELRTARSLFSYQHSRPMRTGASPSDYDFEKPDNHGDEWSLRHIEMITAADRPSDQVLSEKLGRTPGAIRAMRYQMQREKKT